MAEAGATEHRRLLAQVAEAEVGLAELVRSQRVEAQGVLEASHFSQQPQARKIEWAAVAEAAEVRPTLDILPNLVEAAGLVEAQMVSMVTMAVLLYLGPLEAVAVVALPQ
jgi:hypothetical protein